MQQSLSWKASKTRNSRNLWIPKFHYPNDNSPPPVPMLSQSNPVHDQISQSVNIHFNIILPLTPRYSPPKLCISFPLLHMCYMPRLSHSSRLIIICEECRSSSSSLCSLLQSHVTSSLLGRNTFLSTPFSKSLSLCSPYNARDQVSNPYKTQSRTIVLYTLTL